MFKKMIHATFALCLVITATSCATIISGRTQQLPVSSQPSGAMVTVGSMKQVTPASFELDRRKGIYVVKVEKKGYEPVEITLKKGMNGWLLGNIVFGGIIGLVIDFSTGSAYRFTPTEVEIELAKEQYGLKHVEGQDVLIVKLKESAR